MELCANHGAAPDNGSDVGTIIHMGKPLFRVLHLEMVRVHEIGVIAGTYACQHRVRAINDQIIPAHMWHLKRSGGWQNTNHLTFDPVETGRIGVFAPPTRHHLHPHADAKKRAGTVHHGVRYRLKQPAIASQGSPARGERTVARQHDAVCAGHVFGAGGDEHITAVSFSCHPLKSFFSRMQIAAIVID